VATKAIQKSYIVQGASTAHMWLVGQKALGLETFPLFFKEACELRKWGHCFPAYLSEQA